MEKQLIQDVGRELFKIRLEHVVISESEATIKDSWQKDVETNLKGLFPSIVGSI